MQPSSPVPPKTPTPCKTPVTATPAKPLSAPSKRKRRRPPPPLSVTSVFTPQRLPKNSADVWQWPVTSWYVGDVGEDDLKLASERPFVDHVALARECNEKPLPKHYRLRWLEDDARAIVSRDPGNAPSIPEGFALLPYASKKDTSACARPMPGVKRLLDYTPRQRRGTKHSQEKPLKKLCISPTPTKIPNPPSPTPQLFAKSPSNISTTTLLASANIPSSSLNPVCKSESVPHAEPMQIDPPFAKHKAGEFSFAKASTLPKISIKPLHNAFSPPYPTLNTPLQATAFHKTDEVLPVPTACAPVKNTLVKQSPSANGFGIAEKQCFPVNGVASELSSPPQPQQVCLQFQSSAESRLMGSLTYSLSAPTRKEGHLLNNDGSGQRSEDAAIGVGLGAHVEGFELDFRKADADFAVGFGDIAVADELRFEIQKRSNMLLTFEERAKPLRSAMLEALQTEFEKQKEFVDLIDEEKHLVARLKEIEQEKKAARAAVRATAMAEASANRRKSGRRRSAARSRSDNDVDQSPRRPRSRSRRTSRPSRKLLEELDDEDEITELKHSPDNLPLAPHEPVSASVGTACATTHQNAGLEANGPTTQQEVTAGDTLASPLAKAATALLPRPLSPKEEELMVPQQEASVPPSEPPIETSVPNASASVRMFTDAERTLERGPSAARSPSDDGTAVGLVQSPCGIFPGEPDESAHASQLPSPVSPLHDSKNERGFEKLSQVKIPCRPAMSAQVITAGYEMGPNDRGETEKGISQ